MAKAAASGNSSEQHTQQGLKETLLEKQGLCFLLWGTPHEIVGIACPEPWVQTRQTHSSTLLHYPLFCPASACPAWEHPDHTQSAVWVKGGWAACW